MGWPWAVSIAGGIEACLVAVVQVPLVQVSLRLPLAPALNGSNRLVNMLLQEKTSTNGASMVQVTI